MINFDFEKYTGRNVRIVFMDSGYLDDIYCLDKNGEILEKRFNNTSNDHLKSCIETLRLSAPGAECIVINVGENDSGIITEENTIQGFKTAMETMPKIIVASFSFAFASKEFISIINDIIDKGIIICASVDPIVKKSYPQIIQGVISVDEYISESNNAEIKIFNDTFLIPQNHYKSVGKNGSSFANAFFAGIIAQLVEFSPLITGHSLYSFFKNEMKDRVIDNVSNTFWLVSNQHDMKSLNGIISDNYNFFYDSIDSKFKSIKSYEEIDEKKISSVDVVCADDFIQKNPKEINILKDKKIPYFCLNNFSEDINYLKEDLTSVKAITIPSIYIFSYGMDKDKFKIHTYLYKKLKVNEFSVGNITFNPIAKIIGFRHVVFPNTILYPDYIYYLNNELYNESLSKDIIIVSGAGDFDRFVGFEHRFGNTSEILFEANIPDIVILSITDSIDVKEIKKAKLFIENTIGAKILFYLSQKSTDDNYYGPADYNLINSESTTIEYAKQLADELGTNIFTLKDFESDKFYSDIIRLFE